MAEKFIPNPDKNPEGPLSENILFDDDLTELNKPGQQIVKSKDGADLQNIRIPVDIKREITRLNVAMDQANSDEDVTDKKLAEKLHWSPEKVRLIRMAAGLEQTVSLEDLNDRYELWLAEQNLDKTEDLPTQLHESVHSTEESVEDQALEQAKKDWIHEMLDRKLNEKEKRIIKMRFGFEDGQEHTLAEIARSEGLSPERIRVIADRAIAKLRYGATYGFRGNKLDIENSAWLDKDNPQQYGVEFPKIPEEIMLDIPSNSRVNKLRKESAEKQKIRESALRILESYPEGINIYFLINNIQEDNPDIKEPNISQYVWKISEKLPDDVYMSEDGILQLTKFR